MLLGTKIVYFSENFSYAFNCVEILEFSIFHETNRYLERALAKEGCSCLTIS